MHCARFKPIGRKHGNRVRLEAHRQGANPGIGPTGGESD
jgi:hypothetical protein